METKRMTTLPALSRDQRTAYAAKLRTARARNAVSDGKPFLRLDRSTGEFKFGTGTEAKTIGDVELFAVNPLSFQHGYLAFFRNELHVDVAGNQAKLMLPVTEDIPMPLPQLADVRGMLKRDEKEPEWQQTMSADLTIIGGSHDGSEVSYSPVSLGGRDLINGLSAEIAHRLEEGHDDFVPIVELYAERLDRGQYKDVWTPFFEIKEWRTLEDISPVEAAPAKAEPARIADAGARQPKAAAQEREAEPVEAEEPRRRRVRR
jgi:hypothetical protein